MQNYDLRFVKIGCFSGNMEYGGATTNNLGQPETVYFLEVDNKTVKHVMCVIDEANQTATDIRTKTSYHIIQRDLYNRIIEPSKNLIPNTYYALHVGEKCVKTDDNDFTKNNTYKTKVKKKKKES